MDYVGVLILVMTVCGLGCLVAGVGPVILRYIYERSMRYRMPGFFAEDHRRDSRLDHR